MSLTEALGRVWDRVYDILLAACAKRPGASILIMSFCTFNDTSIRKSCSSSWLSSVPQYSFRPNSAVRIVVQVLSHLPLVLSYFQHSCFRGPLMQRLRQSCADLSSGRQSLRAMWAYNPKNVLTALVAKEKRFSGLDQQDAHELFECIMHHASTSTRSAGLRLFTCPSGAPSVPFEGWITSTMTCRICGWTRPVQEHNVESVECVNCTLGMLLQQQTTELENLIAVAQSVPGTVPLMDAQRDARYNLAELQALTDAIRSGCRVATDEDLALCGITDPARASYSKSLMVSRWPTLLCLHLGRLHYDPQRQAMRKNRVRVQFPLELSSAELRASARSMAACPYHYQLRAVVVHHGGATSGHYTVFIRVDGTPSDCGETSEKWYHISDETVTLCPIGAVLKSDAYMLFYEDKRETKRKANSGVFSYYDT